MQYRMTLAFNGLVEPSTSNMTLDLSGRITGIRKREEKLHRANFSCARTRLLSPITGHIVWQPIVSASGSIAHAITTANGNNFLQVYLPSALSTGDVWCNWDVPLDRPGLPMRPAFVAIDPLQDLLVVAEEVGDSWYVCKGGRLFCFSHYPSLGTYTYTCDHSVVVGRILTRPRPCLS